MVQSEIGASCGAVDVLSGGSGKQIPIGGNYILVDHALARLDRGAWGILEVEGEENPDVYKQK